MIGFYSYTVVLTYLGLASAAMGMILTIQGFAKYALFCLAFSGLCDMFDGKVARMKKNRTEDEKRFGIQIDSLNDLVCFGVLPAAIGWSTGCQRLWFLATMSFFTLCALIRLAYFNVTEEERQDKTNENRRYYLGLPVTSSAFVMPFFYLLALYAGRSAAILYAIGAFLLGVLYISPLRIKKVGLRGVALLSAVGLAEFAALVHMIRA